MSGLKDDKLKSVIILCQHFPPSPSTASNRPLSWAVNFHTKGYFPIVFCKNEKNDQSCFIEKHTGYEVHYIAYREHLFQRKISSTKNSLIRKFWIILNLLFQNSIRVNGIQAILPFASRYIKENDVKLMIATANPFAIFGLANKLSKLHSIKWIADYRDDWTSDSVLDDDPIFKLLKMSDISREKKYLRSCSFFTTVSDHYIVKINGVIHKAGFMIENGFMSDKPGSALNQHKTSGTNTKLTILFSGTLYRTQKVGILANAMDLLPESVLNKFEIIFLGSFMKTTDMPGNFSLYLDKTILFKQRVSADEANQFLDRSDALLFLPHTDSNGKLIKGIPSSKLYDYIKTKKPILVCPSDHDIVERKLLETGQGIFCNDGKELSETIIQLLAEKERTGQLSKINIPEEVYQSNTREYQAGLMAALLDKL